MLARVRRSIKKPDSAQESSQSSKQDRGKRSISYDWKQFTQDVFKVQCRQTSHICHVLGYH